MYYLLPKPPEWVLSSREVVLNVVYPYFLLTESYLRHWEPQRESTLCTPETCRASCINWRRFTFAQHKISSWNQHTSPASPWRLWWTSRSRCPTRAVWDRDEAVDDVHKGGTGATPWVTDPSQQCWSSQAADYWT